MAGVWEERWSEERDNNADLNTLNDCCIQLAATRENACIVLKQKQRSKAHIYECIIISATTQDIFKQLHGENLLMEKLNQNIYSD